MDALLAVPPCVTDAFRETLQTTLGTAYTIERELGGGGMSRVFVADDVSLGRKIVVKIIAPDLAEGLSIERFSREVKLAARLQQANIVPVLTAGDAKGLPFYTMPFVEGLSLRARLQQGALPIGEAVNILRDMARALAYAHSHSVVHRDIKPENVLLSGGAAVVTDFGIAKALSASRTQAEPGPNSTGALLTRAGMSLGTPAYMAPEQALGDPNTDHRADLYSWGVVAWEMLAGAHPFAGRTTPQAMVKAHVTDAPPQLSTRRPDVPPALADVITRCLAKNPERRPASASEVMEALDVVSMPTSVPLGARRSYRSWAIAAGLLVVVAVGVAAVARRDSGSAATRTVVVVPFENLGDASDAYFAEGVSDEIAGQLARLPGLQVIGREGVQKFRGSGRSPRDIARELGASYVLSGTVRWARGAVKNGGVDGDTRVRIVPALLNVSNGTQEWGEPSEERLTDVFKVQAQVAERVASALSVRLGGAERAVMTHAESNDAEARDAQMLGRYLLRQRGPENLRRAMGAFERAIARDSGYARAWAGLSESSALLPAYYDTTETDDVVFARAERAALRAVALDSTLPEVQLALARSYRVQFKFNQALLAVDRALTLDPNATLAWALKYEILTALGRAAAADSAARRAVQLDGVSALALNNRAVSLASMGHLDSALWYSERAVEIDPSMSLWKRTLGTLYAMGGRYDDGVRLCSEGAGPANACADMTGLIAGREKERAAGLAKLGARSQTPGTLGAPMWAAMIYAQIGMTDSMFSRLRVAIERRDDSFGYLITMPMFAKYESDPRWDAIVGEVRRR